MPNENIVDVCWELALLYGGAGISYIIVATYFPLMAKTFHFHLFAKHLWLLIGMAIILSFSI
ncbi:YbfB/YjiJ family MFS transporter [Bartonella massiliensis]|uniref:YbfB/YjiJ family MFS transporter n=1 Tax=Bartonella massiliensis TaxID=929795 RepID=UPI003CCC633F